MKWSLAATVIVGLLCAGSALSDTVKGKATSSKPRTFGFPAAGQVMITLAWTKASADLDMMWMCEFSNGSSVSTEDRFERMEFGAFGGGEECMVTVTAFSGSSKFTLNVQDTGTVLGSARRPLLRLISDSETPPELSELIERLKRAKARMSRAR